MNNDSHTINRLVTLQNRRNELHVELLKVNEEIQQLEQEQRVQQGLRLFTARNSSGTKTVHVHEYSKYAARVALEEALWPDPIYTMHEVKV